MTSAAVETLDLQTIPGVGPSIARDLTELGIRRVRDLEGRDPHRLYEQLSSRRGQRMDPCVLYVFRCAVYYAETHAADTHAEARAETRAAEAHAETGAADRELLKWWNWKDRVHANERSRAPA